MIEEHALVIGETRRGYVKVKIQRQSACESCKLKAGCGQSTLNKLSSNKCIEMDVQNHLHAKAGDTVSLAISEQGLLSASILVYMLPLILMLAASVFTQSILGWQDAATAVSGLGALALGFAYARYYARQHQDDERYKPEMVRILPGDSTVIHSLSSTN